MAPAMPKAPRRRYHHGNLRAEVLRQAEKTLRQAGYRDLSLREVAKQLGVSHAAPRRHFSSMDRLLDALACLGYERLHAGAAAAIGEPPPSLGTSLVRLGRAYVRFAAANPALLELMLVRKHTASAPPELRAAARRFYTLAIDRVAGAQAAGELVRGPAVRVALPLFAAIQGLVVIARQGRIDGQPVESLVDEVVTRILSGLRPR